MARPRTLIRVVVQPRASRNEILGLRGEVLQVKVTAPPEGGKANEALVELLARALKVAKSRVRVIRGHTSRDKWVAMEDLSPDDFRSRIGGERPE